MFHISFYISTHSSDAKKNILLETLYTFLKINNFDINNLLNESIPTLRKYCYILCHIGLFHQLTMSWSYVHIEKWPRNLALEITRQT